MLALLCFSLGDYTGDWNVTQQGSVPKRTFEFGLYDTQKNFLGIVWNRKPLIGADNKPDLKALQESIHAHFNIVAKPYDMYELAFLIPNISSTIEFTIQKDRSHIPQALVRINSTLTFTLSFDDTNYFYVYLRNTANGRNERYLVERPLKLHINTWKKWTKRLTIVGIALVGGEVMIWLCLRSYKSGKDKELEGIRRKLAEDRINSYKKKRN